MTNKYQDWVGMKLNLPPEIITKLDSIKGSKSRAAMIVDVLSDKLRDYEATYEVTYDNTDKPK